MLLGLGGTVCIGMQNFVKIGETVVENFQLFSFSIWQLSDILD